MNKYWVSYQANEMIEAETLEEAEEKMLKEVISNLVNCNNDYLIIGGNSRMEDFVENGSKRTAVFWIG